MNLDFEKYADGLLPVIVQDARTQRVLMLGFVDPNALDRTQETGKVTFYSRSRRQLWTKGETSGNFLAVEEIIQDCDSDTLLIKAVPSGPVCHTGSDTCFGEKNCCVDLLFTLEDLIRQRKAKPLTGSYTSKLFSRGLDKIAQKVGEEAVELVIEAKNNDDERFKAEAADLLYHFLVLLTEKNVPYSDILAVLNERRRAS